MAKRLALLGALTQGDRRATGQSSALGLGGFDMDNIFGGKALRTMLNGVWECSPSSFSDGLDSHFVEVLKAIDSHLSVVLEEEGDWRENLSPEDLDSKSEESYYSVMKDLLLGPGLALGEQRVAAIQQGKSIAKYLQSLEDGSETAESVKAKIDEEVKDAKEVGLNVNMLFFLWLFDVGITKESSGPPMNVPKFLNRVLGMNVSCCCVLCILRSPLLPLFFNASFTHDQLPRQKLVTEHFLAHLSKEITDAKRAGNYDKGIKTISGDSVIDKPRSFCFRGFEAENERILVYRVKVDSGMNSETALNLYNEAKDSEGGEECQTVESGFYIDRRQDVFEEVPRIFLILRSSREKCIVIRPNRGKKTFSQLWVKVGLLDGPAKLSLCTDVSQAVEIWKKEYELADRPSNERYQRYCYGRHEERFVFGGSVVPILNKLIVAAKCRSTMLTADEEEENMEMPSIVRVEPPMGKSTGGNDENTAVSDSSTVNRRPILTEEEEKHTEEYEKIFEEEHDYNIPSILVGLEWKESRTLWYSQKEKRNIMLPLWNFVLRNLAESLLEEGAQTSRETLQLEKAEMHS